MVAAWSSLIAAVLAVAGPATAPPTAEGAGDDTASEQAAAPGGSLHEPIPSNGAAQAAPEGLTTSRPPDWVLAAPVRKGKVHRTTVSSGPHVRARDCARALQKEFRAATDQYVDWWIREQFGRDRASEVIHIDAEYINSHLRNPDYEYHEVRQYSVGPMHTSYAMLQFDEPFRKLLNQRWEEAVAKSRLLYTAVLGGLILALLGVLFCYFRLDTATRGFYRGRLRFVAAAAILALLAAGLLASHWIPRI